MYYCVIFIQQHNYVQISGNISIELKILISQSPLNDR